MSTKNGNCDYYCADLLLNFKVSDIIGVWQTKFSTMKNF